MIASLHCGIFVLLDIERGVSVFLFYTHVELFMYGHMAQLSAKITLNNF